MTRRGRLAPVPLLLRERAGFQSNAHLPAARSTGNLRARENRPGGPSPGRPMRLTKLVRRPLRARPKREYGAPGGSFRPGGSPAALIRVRRRGGARATGRMGLLRRSGAGACPNLLQRHPGPGSAARRSAEYQRSSSGAPVRSGPLQQIWTNDAAEGRTAAAADAPIGRTDPVRACAGGAPPAHAPDLHRREEPDVSFPPIPAKRRDGRRPFSRRWRTWCGRGARSRRTPGPARSRRGRAACARSPRPRRG